MTPFSNFRFMDAALAIARSGLGSTSPNPSVGCVVVQAGRIVGSGRTADGGRPHAETIALADAGSAARGATVYVTLEPCAHTGQTPPCADALIAAGVSRVVIACRDPDSRVDGRGADRLARSGIETVSGIREAEAHVLNAGFLSVLTRSRPFVAIDGETQGYDATLPTSHDGDWSAELRNLAQAGVTRVHALPDTPCAEALRQADLVDFDALARTTGR